jgi:hypothetical protein
MSILYQHMKTCIDSLCVCHSRAACFDLKTNRNSNFELPIWKDPVFLKNFVWSILEQNVRGGKSTLQLEQYFLLFSLEKLEKTVVTGILLKPFRQKVRSLSSLGYWFSVYSIEEKMQRMVTKQSQEYPYAKNDFENLAIYDNQMNELK